MNPVEVDRKKVGRPKGTKKEITKDVQVSFRCERQFKNLVIHMSRAAGYSSYQKFLRDLVEHSMRGYGK